MHDRIYWVCADVLILAVQIPSAPNLPPAAELRQRIIGGLDTMVSKGRAAGIADEDLVEARYALTAFVDEQILKSNWPGRADWMNQPLQLVLYREYTAGENFFARMRALLQRGAPSPALQIYYLCLVLGFRGRYAVSGDVGSLSAFTDSARQLLGPALPPPAKIGPRVQPQDRAEAVRTSNVLLYAVLGGCALLALSVLGGLSWGLSSALRDGLRALPEPSASPAEGGRPQTRPTAAADQAH